MRVLWVSPNGGNYKSKVLKGTGGWIGALQTALCEAYPELELGITFFHATDTEIIRDRNVTYIPISYNYGNNNVEKLFFRHFRNEDAYREKRLLEMANQIRQFKPDIIHIWGIENYYAGVLELINDIPSVVHIQGITSSFVFNHKVVTPPCFSYVDFIHADKWINRIVFKRGIYESLINFEHRAIKEKQLAPLVKNWIGRTKWDQAMSQLLSPGSRYFHCDELMRQEFFNGQWNYHHDNKNIIIHSSIGSAWYKGIDIILKTAYILKSNNYSITWNVYGITRFDDLLRFFIKKLGITPEDVNVFFHGNVDAQTIKNSLLSCDCFVHSSYLENSSNAIAEAQILGVPVIAQYIGGNPSMLRDGSGLLVAPNEPYIMAESILSLLDEDKAKQYSYAASSIAKQRNSTKNVLNSLIDTYKSLI